MNVFFQPERLSNPVSRLLTGYSWIEEYNDFWTDCAAYEYIECRSRINERSRSCSVPVSLYAPGWTLMHAKQLPRQPSAASSWKVCDPLPYAPSASTTNSSDNPLAATFPSFTDLNLHVQVGECKVQPFFLQKLNPFAIEKEQRSNLWSMHDQPCNAMVFSPFYRTTAL